MTMAINSTNILPKPFSYKVNTLFKSMLEKNIHSKQREVKERQEDEIYSQTKEALSNFQFQNALTKSQVFYA